MEPCPTRVALVVDTQAIEQPTGTRSRIVGRCETKPELIPRLGGGEMSVQRQFVQSPSLSIVAHPRGAQGPWVRNQADGEGAVDRLGSPCGAGWTMPSIVHCATRPIARRLGQDRLRNGNLRHVSDHTWTLHLRTDETSRHLSTQRRVLTAEKKRTMPFVGAGGQGRVQRRRRQIDRGPRTVGASDGQPAVGSQHGSSKSSTSLFDAGEARVRRPPLSKPSVRSCNPPENPVRVS